MPLICPQKRSSVVIKIRCIIFLFFADAPRVDLTLGKSISPGSIYEGGDVYFDCLVIASPKPYKILWFQDVSIRKDYDLMDKFNIIINLFSFLPGFT